MTSVYALYECAGHISVSYEPDKYVSVYVAIEVIVSDPEDAIRMAKEEAWNKALPSDHDGFFYEDLVEVESDFEIRELTE